MQVKYVKPCDACHGRGLKTYKQIGLSGETIDIIKDYCPQCGGTGEEWGFCDEDDLLEGAEIVEYITDAYELYYDGDSFEINLEEEGNNE